MAQKVVWMESKLAAVLVDQAAGNAVSVVDVCANLGISRQTYYKYRKRFSVDGVSGLEPRSRRPTLSPALTGPEMTERVVRARKSLVEEGWDNGVVSIRYRLIREGLEQVPAVRTIHRVLARAGLIDPDPSKARRSRHRFEFPATDDCWQFDAFEYALADGTFVVVFELQDDHSRYLLANLAWPREDTVGAWECVKTAIACYQTVPVMLLTDNGLAFNGKRHARTVLLERNATALGIKPITTRPYHPQTNGKNERLHGTARKWLRRQPPAGTLAQLQAQLDTYRHGYNQQRPHQSLAGATPAERRSEGIRRRPNVDQAATLDRPVATVVEAKANNRGTVGGVPGTTVALGIEHAGKRVSIFTTDSHVLIFHRHHLIRELTIDPAHRHQPLGVGRGSKVHIRKQQQTVSDVLASNCQRSPGT